MRLIFVIGLWLIATHLVAQSFTQRIQQKKAGEGTVLIYEDPAIDELVNGKKASNSSSANKTTPAVKPVVSKLGDKTQEDNTSLGDGEAPVSKRKVYKKSYSISGYRLQLYSGDDSRNARQKAYALGSKFKNLFPNVPVYTHFYSPHWICRVGDFRTYEEANAYLHQLRKIGGFAEAAIIRCKIQVGY